MSKEILLEGQVGKLVKSTIQILDPNFEFKGDKIPSEFTLEDSTEIRIEKNEDIYTIFINDVYIKLSKEDEMKPLYWSSELNPKILSAFNVVSITSRRDKNTIYKSYSDLISKIPSNDDVSELIVTYAMLESDDKNPYFDIEDNDLVLYSDIGEAFVSRSIEIDVNEIQDAYTLYEFSPRYRNLPIDVNAVVTLLGAYILPNMDIKFIETFEMIKNDPKQVESLFQYITPNKNTEEIIRLIVEKYNILNICNSIIDFSRNI